MKFSTNPHDSFVRAMMANMTVAKAFFTRYLPSQIVNVLDINSIRLEDGTYVDSRLQKSLSDLVYDCRYLEPKGSVGAKIVLLVEHQSTPQKLLPFRVYHYMFSLLNRQLKARHKKHSTSQLPAVYALVLYNGKQSPYPYSLLLSDCFDDPHNIMKPLFTEAIPLIDLNQENDQELKELKWLGIQSLALKYARDKDPSTLLQLLVKIFKTIDYQEPNARDLLNTAFSYILSRACLPFDVELWND